MNIHQFFAKHLAKAKSFILGSGNKSALISKKKTINKPKFKLGELDVYIESVRMQQFKKKSSAKKRKKICR